MYINSNNWLTDLWVRPNLFIFSLLYVFHFLGSLYASQLSTVFCIFWMLSWGDFGFSYFLVTSAVTVSVAGRGIGLEFQTPNSLQIGFKCVCVQELPMSRQCAVSSLHLDGHEVTCFQSNSEVSKQCEYSELGNQLSGSFLSRIPPSSSTLTLSWNQFSSFTGHGFSFYKNPSQVWIALSLWGKTVQIGMYLSPFL